MIRKFATLLSAALLHSGCVVEHRGPVRTETRTIERDGSEAVRLNLHMGAGRLRVGGGTGSLMRAMFTYDRPSTKPEVRYSSTAGRASIDISQPDFRGNIGKNEYEWDIQLSRDVPANVAVKFGAGEAELDLGGLPLRGVDVEMGVGKLDLDLRGKPLNSYSVSIRGGIGEAVVRLPRDIGVVAEAEGGIGGIHTSGLRKQGSRYVNDFYMNSKVTVRLDIHGGIGSIRLLAD
jgi:hypothetical protein